MAGNPRIDDLRKRLEREPGSRLFAQLAEELRKDGQFGDAIRIAREGLERHPSYPSARMTLGRALFDSGDVAGARREFEAVVKAAPDNLLAGRLLGECLEALGDPAGALERYRATLALSQAGDPLLSGRVAALERRQPRPGKVAPPPPSSVRAPAEEPPEAAVPEALVPDEPAPIPLASVDFPMELEAAYLQPVTSVAGVAPAGETEDPGEHLRIPLLPVEDAFELERSFEAPAGGRPAAPTVPARDAPGEAMPPRPRADEPTADADEPALEVEALLPDAFPDAVAPDDLASPTLAELYFSQGLTARAIEVYQRLLQREPNNQRARSRLDELRSQVAPAPAPEPGAPAAAGGPSEARRQAIQRTIIRLEEFRVALRKR